MTKSKLLFKDIKYAALTAIDYYFDDNVLLREVSAPSGIGSTNSYEYTYEIKADKVVLTSRCTRYTAELDKESEQRLRLALASNGEITELTTDYREIT